MELRKWTEIQFEKTESFRHQTRFGRVVYVPYQRLIIMGGEYGDENNPVYDNSVHELMLKSKHIQKLPSLCEGKSCFAFFYKYPTRWLYTVGGESAIDTITKSCEKFDVYNKKWTRLPDVLTVRCNPGLLEFDDKYLYSFGGFHGKFPKYYAVADVDKLDLKMNVWEPI